MGTYRIHLIFFVFCGVFLSADTFRHQSGSSIYHGYVVKADENGLVQIQTVEAGLQTINLSEYDYQLDRSGRNNTVAVLPIDDQISYEIETAAFEQALVEEASRGPLFILIEIDTPGGRVDLTQRLCAVISGLRFCPTIAYIKGEKNLGAYSAGTAIALACDKIYMAPNTAMGAVTAIVSVGGKYKTEKEVFGEDVGEKFGSAWRNYLAALAERNQRPGILAKAMEDKDIEVVEVQREGKTVFLDSADRRPSDRFVRIFNKKGELLTLTPDQAVHCRMANGIAESQVHLLAELDATGAEVHVNQDLLAAREELLRVVKRFNKLMETLDLRFKELEAKEQRHSLRRSDALRNLQDILRQADYLIRLKQRYPDVPVEEQDLMEFKNSVQADYESLRMMR